MISFGAPLHRDSDGGASRFRSGHSRGPCLNGSVADQGGGLNSLHEARASGEPSIDLVFAPADAATDRDRLRERRVLLANPKQTRSRAADAFILQAFVSKNSHLCVPLRGLPTTRAV